jgi:hypothetical protein
MTITCKNCGTSFKGNFCYNCGQAANTHRLNAHSVWHDIQHGLLHVDKGIFYTLIQLFTRPGYSIREYLEGKRVKHFKPVSLVIILATVYALANHYLHISMIEENNNTVSIRNFGFNFNFTATQGQGKPLITEITEFVVSHFALFQLLFLPFYAGATRLAFRKSGYNYVEHLIINAFLRGQAIVIAMFMLPFIYIGVLGRETSSNIVAILQIICFFWVFLQIENQSKKGKVIKRCLLTMLYLFVELVLFISVTALTINLFQ